MNYLPDLIITAGMTSLCVHVYTWYGARVAGLYALLADALRVLA